MTSGRGMVSRATYKSSKTPSTGQSHWPTKVQKQQRYGHSRRPLDCLQLAVSIIGTSITIIPLLIATGYTGWRFGDSYYLAIAKLYSWSAGESSEAQENANFLSAILMYLSFGAVVICQIIEFEAMKENLPEHLAITWLAIVCGKAYLTSLFIMLVLRE
jgi:hypothetical protein